MRLPVEALLLIALPSKAAVFTFYVEGAQAGPWPAVLGSMGLVRGPSAEAGLIVFPSNAKAAGGDWAARVEHGTILIVEGASPLAASFGFRASAERITVRAVEDLHAPQLDIVWEHPAGVPRFEVPSDARVFVHAKHSTAPLIAGIRRGSGAVLWVAASPGEHGYERFPYLPQALLDLDLKLPFRSNQLWAFFDASYRARVDLDYFARHWRDSGIAALQVAAWHNWERDPAADAYLEALIQACHRHSILVYAWLEFPHVSEKFWAGHPEWREKTALLQDAQLDWRKLMNLSNPEASAAVAAGLRDLVNRFDWDGVNLAEMYFESLEGHENAARFTPMNNDVRARFQAETGFDPLDLFQADSPRSYRSNPAGLARFLDFRAGLAWSLERQWIARVDELRKSKPYLDLVLTHVDDRFDPAMRDKIGADAARTLPLLNSAAFTFLVEDPANLWNLGPERYTAMASRYRAMTTRPEKLGIDINVVERYQDVYPTKRQTGAELLQLIHTAASAFPRLALYFESSIAELDWPLLAHAAAVITSTDRTTNGWNVTSPSGVSMAWDGPALVDGRPWPATTGSMIHLPSGSHTIEPAHAHPAMRILDFNGRLKSASATPSGVELVYESDSRALVRLSGTPTHVWIDGVENQPHIPDGVVMLPGGQHLATIWR